MEGKGNDGKGNIPERDLWETKQDLFENLNKQYSFEFDCCANKENSKCDNFSDNFEEWDKILRVCWMNPPFSNSTKMFEHFFKVVKKGVAIYRCDNMETKVWQNVILRFADWVFIPRGRISYTTFEIGNMQKDNEPRFPSALIGIGVEIPKNIQGKILFTKLNGGKFFSSQP